jgi:hypothetical protein
MLDLFLLIVQHFFRPADIQSVYALSTLDQEIMGVCTFCRSIISV